MENIEEFFSKFKESFAYLFSEYYESLLYYYDEKLSKKKLSIPDKRILMNSFFISIIGMINVYRSQKKVHSFFDGIFEKENFETKLNFEEIDIYIVNKLFRLIGLIELIYARKGIKKNETTLELLSLNFNIDKEMVDIIKNNHKYRGKFFKEKEADEVLQKIIKFSLRLFDFLKKEGCAEDSIIYRKIASLYLDYDKNEILTTRTSCDICNGEAIVKGTLEINNEVFGYMSINQFTCSKCGINICGKNELEKANINKPYEVKIIDNKYVFVKRYINKDGTSDGSDYEPMKMDFLQKKADLLKMKCTACDTKFTLSDSLYGKNSILLSLSKNRFGKCPACEAKIDIFDQYKIWSDEMKETDEVHKLLGFR